METLFAIESQIPYLQLTTKSWVNIVEEDEDDKPFTFTKSQMNKIIAKKQQEALIAAKPSKKQKASPTPNFPKMEQVVNLAPLLLKIWDDST